MDRTTARHAVVATALLAARPLHAADTIEPFEPGLSDFETYAGAEGLGLVRSEQTLFAEGTVGCGVTPRLSFYVAPTFSVDGYLAAAVPDLVLGGYGTPFEGDHFDLDLGLDLATDGAVMSYSPFFELNFDGEPELAFAGLYLRGGMDVFGEPNEQGQAATRLGAQGTIGAYVNIARCHQLLAELDGAWFAEPKSDTPDAEMGALQLGYNVLVHDAVEIINEISADVPRSGEDWSYGVSMGLLMTLPARE